jgi:hypothetical protein
MGLLTLDLCRFGVVMGADSQPIDLLEGSTRIHSQGQRNANPIVEWHGARFTGLIGYVGRRSVAGLSTRSWLERFMVRNRDLTTSDFCERLAGQLTAEWRRLHLRSGLWVYVSGVANRDVQFWFVNNIAGIDPNNGTYSGIADTFKAVNDFDQNYVTRDRRPGETKDQLLDRALYTFRNGALYPSTTMLDAFSATVLQIFNGNVPGFAPIRSLDDLAFFARQRLEFTKRLHSPTHGIYKGSRSPIDGKVHVLAVTRSGEVRECSKNISQRRHR